MNKLISRFKNFINYFRDDFVPIANKNLYIVLIYAIVACIAMVITFLCVHVPIASVLFISSAMVMLIIICYLSIRFENVKLFKYFISIFLNMFLLPSIFYLSFDVFNGTALFFPVGIIFTFFLIQERSVYLVFAVELIWYGYIVLFPAFNYEKLSAVRPETAVNGIAMDFFVAAIGPIFILIYQSVIANRTKKSLYDSQKMIEEARQNKSRFLANMTHEIRTPMNAIFGMNELILREELNPEAREFAENIKDSSNQLLKTINNILEYSKLDSGKMELIPQKYDFAEMITEIINSVSNEYASEDSEFSAKIDPQIPRLLFGDNIRIKQVFMYLLFSSINLIPHSRISFEVKGDVDINTNSVLLSCTISESGFGLSDSEIEAMLSAYSRYDSRQKSSFKSMGLELLICNEILKLMGGTLTIDSVKGVGMSVHFEFLNYIIEDTPIVRISQLNEYSILVYTKNTSDQNIWEDILASFQLYPNFVNGPNAFRQAIENKRFTHIFIDDMFYPILKDTITSAQIMDQVYVIAEAGSVYSDFDKCKIIRKPMTSICVSNALNNLWDESAYKVSQKRESVKYPEGKVLIVDDSVVNLRVLEGMLETFDMNITKCKSGSEALEILEENTFDLIILDQRMPEMDGIELLHIIRKMENVNSIIPILCATADFGPEVSQYLLNEGFQNYLAKPIRKFYLERMLREYMPRELAVNFEIEEKTDSDKEKEAEDSTPKDNPLDIDFENGLENVGGNEAAFASVVNADYKEGLSKINLINDYLSNNDITNYVIDVHALKSSSAAIGAKGLSALFKELEFAGRGNNIEFLNAHTSNVINMFSRVLDKVHDYLVSIDAYEEDNADMPDGEEVEFDRSLAEDIIKALEKFSIKDSEEKIAALSTTNFGPKINSCIKDIKKCIDTFDYIKAKEMLKELIDKE